MPVQPTRIDPRDDYHHQVDYLLEPNTSGRVYKGVTIDISESGLGLYVFAPLETGQQITIKGILRSSRRTGTIRWSKRVSEDISRVGMVFVH